MSRRPLLVAGLLLLLGAAIGWHFWRGVGPARRTVVLISIDTARPDRLGIYGNSPDVSPRIDALAQQSVVFERALANSPYTLPSHMSMLTGLDPVAHGVKRDGTVLSTKVTTLAEALRQAGFQCGAFTDGGFVSAHYGFSQGFHVYDDKRDGRKEGAVNGFARILPRAEDWLDAHSGEDVFLFVHTFDVHTPYQEGDPDVQARFRERPTPDGPRDHELYRMSFMHQQASQRIPEYGRMSELLNDYDAGLHEADRGVGRLLDKLQEQGRLEDALVIVTSDHGESFADHGVHVGHGITLTDDEIHIPMLVKFPGRQAAGKRTPVPVDLTDLAPTVLDAFGLSPIPEMHGESLLSLVRGQPRRHDHIFGISPNTESCFLVRNNWKFISHPAIPPIDVAKRHLCPVMPPSAGLAEAPCTEYEAGPEGARVKLCYDDAGDPLGILDTIVTGPQLYDLRADPNERVNLATQDHERVAQMAAWAKEIYESSRLLNDELREGEATPVIGETHVDASLAQLGYLGAASDAEIDEFLSKLPADTRKALQHGRELADTKVLTDSDRAMQFVRVSLRDGRPTGDNASRLLQSLGDSMVAWALANPTLSARVGWRLKALTDLASSAGVAVNRDIWAKKFDAWYQEQIRQRAQPEDGAPGPTNGEQPEDGAH